MILLITWLYKGFCNEWWIILCKSIYFVHSLHQSFPHSWIWNIPVVHHSLLRGMTLLQCRFFGLMAMVQRSLYTLLLFFVRSILRQKLRPPIRNKCSSHRDKWPHQDGLKNTKHNTYHIQNYRRSWYIYLHPRTTLEVLWKIDLHLTFKSIFIHSMNMIILNSLFHLDKIQKSEVVKHKFNQKPGDAFP
jgi:hypothetical protein